MTFATEAALTKAQDSMPHQAMLKAGVACTAATISSSWLSAGAPGAGAAPTTATVCTATTTGAIPLPALTGLQPHINSVALSQTQGSTTFFEDRLAHVYGLSGTSTSVQTVGVDASAASSARRGAADYSEVQWNLECQSGFGATPATLTMQVTYDDNSTQAVAISITASFPVSRRIPIFPATSGRYIKSIQDAQLSVSTGGGTFGIVASRFVGGMTHNGNAGPVLETTANWHDTGLPALEADACLSQAFTAGGAVTVTAQGHMRIVLG